MFNLLTKYGQGAAFSIGVVLVLAFWLMMSGDGDKGLLTPETVADSSATGLGGYVVITLIFLCITAMLVFSVINNLHRPIRAGISGILTLGWLYSFFGVIVPSLFGKVSAATPENLLENGLTAAQDSLVTNGIWLTLALIAVAFLALFGSLIFNFIRG